MTVVGVVSVIESYALTTPRFSATNARPSAAKRIWMGSVRPVKASTSRKWGSVNGLAASAVARGPDPGDRREAGGDSCDRDCREQTRSPEPHLRSSPW